MSAFSPTQRRTAAQLLSSVWNDGKRRVVVTKPEVFRHNGQTIEIDPTRVIDDQFTIALLEVHEIEVIDLEVNGRPKRGKFEAADVDRNANVDAIAHALGIMPNLLHEAVESGKDGALEALASAVTAAARAGYVVEGKVLINMQPQATLDEEIELLADFPDEYAKAVSHGAQTLLDELRGKSRPDQHLHDESGGDWTPGKGD